MFQFQWFCHSIKNFIAKFCHRIDFELYFWDENLKSLLYTPKILLNAHLAKFQFECSFHDLSIKKNSKHFEFRYLESCFGISNKHVF